MSIFKKYLNLTKTSYQESDPNPMALQGETDSGFNPKIEIDKLNKEIVKVDYHDDLFLQQGNNFLKEILDIEMKLKKYQSSIPKYQYYQDVLSSFKKFITTSQENIKERQKLEKAGYALTN